MHNWKKQPIHAFFFFFVTNIRFVCVTVPAGVYKLSVDVGDNGIAPLALTCR